jgi:glycerol kinase
MQRVLAIDQGTTGTKAFVRDSEGRFERVAAFEHAQIYPQSGWVEHDPEELLRNVTACLDAASGSLDAVGLANQGETVVAWDARTKRPLANAIVWQDARTRPAIERLKASGAEALTLERAGLPLDPYFSASKLRRLLDDADGARELHRAGRLRLGTSDSFFLDRLIGESVTDVSTASRTSLMNLETFAWDPELCDLFGVPIECLPEIKPTATHFGTLRTAAGTRVALTASVVDQQGSLFGHGAREPGNAKITFGTGAFCLAVAGAARREARANGILPTVAWQLPGESPCFAIDGGVYNAASALNWARKLGLFHSRDEIDGFDGPSALERGLAFVPALSGLGAPYWDRSAAGMWLGLGLDTTALDLCRAILEGVALRAAQVLRAMDRIVPLAASISIDGGLVQNTYFRAFLARALDRPVSAAAASDLTAFGTAGLAALGAGLGTFAPTATPGQTNNEASPQETKRGASEEAALPAALHDRFDDAVERCRGWRSLE